MNAIYRRPIVIDDYQELKLTGPPISVAASRTDPTGVDLWFEHNDDDYALGTTRFYLWIFGTGHPVPWTRANALAWYFLGTVVTKSGLVWHCYLGPSKEALVPHASD